MVKRIALIASILFVSKSYNETINTQGLYVFGGDVVGSGDTGDAIIRISTSHVTLDLAGHMISQDSGSTGSGFVGIFIDPDLTDITIENGIIGPLDGTGIYISPGCEEITIKSIRISDCTEYGINIDGLVGQQISSISLINSTISGCVAPSAPSIAGLRASYSKSIIAESTYFSGQSAAQGVAYGIYLDNCQTSEFISCKFNRNIGTFGGTGARLNTVTNCRFTNCTLLQNGSLAPSGAAAGYGIFAINSENILCIGTTVAGAFTLNGNAEGIRAEDCNNIGILDSILVENLGTTFCSGCSLVSTIDSVILDSITSGNTATGGSAYGIYLENVSACSIRGNTVLKSTGSSGSFGIADSTNPSSSVIIGNYAFNNGTNYLVTYSLPVTLPVVTGNLSALPGLPSGIGGILDNISIAQ